MLPLTNYFLYTMTELDLCGSIEEAVDGVRDLSRGVLDVLSRVFGEQDVGVLIVEAVVLGSDVLLVVALQAFAKFNI